MATCGHPVRPRRVPHACVRPAVLRAGAVAGECDGVGSPARWRWRPWEPRPPLAARCPAGRPVVVIDPGHDLRANPATEPIGPGSATLKIKDGGGTHGVVTGIREAALAPRRLAAAASPARARGRAGRHDAHEDRRDLDREHRPRGDREHALAPGCSSVSTPTVIRVRRFGGRIPSSLRLRQGWTDDVYRPSWRAARLVQAELVRALGFPDRGISEHIGLHRVQLGRRAGDPGRDGVHDKPHRGSRACDATGPVIGRAGALSGDAALPRAGPRRLLRSARRIGSRARAGAPARPGARSRRRATRPDRRG